MNQLQAIDLTALSRAVTGRVVLPGADGFDADGFDELRADLNPREVRCGTGLTWKQFDAAARVPPTPSGSDEWRCRRGGAALVGEPRLKGYAAAKAGILALTRAATDELAPHGIRVNAIAPGPGGHACHSCDAGGDAGASHRGDAAGAVRGARGDRRHCAVSVHG